MKKILLTVLLLSFLSTSSSAHSSLPFVPAVLFDSWKLDSGGFIESAYNGVLSFEKFRKIDVPVVIPEKTDDNVQPHLHNMVTDAIRKGYNPLICIGFSFSPVISEIAPQYREINFIIVDGALSSLPNVESIVFKEEEGSFLVGYLAAMASKTGRIGFIGGMDCESIRKFGCAFAHGAKYRNRDIVIFSLMTGDDAKAWINPEKGAALTAELVRKGVDVIFHAAGMTGEGVIKEAAKSGIYAIGVDTNQNGIAPGSVLTSMLKRVDVAVFTALSMAADGEFKPDLMRLGLKERAIDWSLDEHNIVLLSEEMISKMDELFFEIVAGRLKPYIYSDEKNCPYTEFAPYSKKDEKRKN